MEIIAIITESSAQNLRLLEGSAVVALIKASSIMLATTAEGLVLSARNQIHGTVSTVNKGAVNSEIIVGAGSGIQVSGIVSNACAESLGLQSGSNVTAIF